MAKVRVGQLAKELGMKVAEILELLRAQGIEAKTNLSMVDAEVTARLRAPGAPTPATAKTAATRPGTAAGAVTPAPRKEPPKPPAAPAGPAPARTPRAQPAAARSAPAPSAATPAPQKPPGTRPAPSPAAGTRAAGATGPAPPAKPGVAHATRPPTPVRPPASGALRPTAPQGTGAVTAGQPAARVPEAPRLAPGIAATRPLAPGTAGKPAAAAPPKAAAGVRPATPGIRPPAGPPPARPKGAVQAPVPVPGARPTLVGARPAPAPARLGRPAAPMAPLRPSAASLPRPAPVVPKRPEPSPPRPPAPVAPPIPEILKEIAITEGVTVKELSEKMDRKAKDIIPKLMTRGVLANINQPLDTKIAVDICREFGFDAKVVSFEEEVSRIEARETPPGHLKPRDPVVTIMGHVDHGKTSLLDAVRQSDIAAGEAGGITQHIGAYHIRRKDRGITFIDTPGHEAFTMMRARGAKVTDIVVLVVAADDGVMPQTIEAIDHARAAGVPLVVAINKVDKPGANLDRVKKQLSDKNLLVEDWGGSVVAVPVSAKQKTGIDELLEMVLLVADMADLKADPACLASGTVLDARLDKARGAVATILVQRGTLRVGDPFIAGAVHGKVRAMFDDLGRRAKEAGPSIPVEVLGLQDVPKAGDSFQVLEAEWKVRQIGAFRQRKIRQDQMAKSARLTLQHLFEQIKEGTVKELPLVVKADVQGSVEALAKTLTDLPSDRVKIRIVHSGSGAISETDVNLASASNAIIIGYNVRPERGAQDLAEQEQVDIRLHSVIYDITNEIRNAMVGLLEPEAKEVYLGRAQVRQLFKVPKAGTIAGCFVSDGRIARSAEVRLLRDNIVVYSGKIGSLKRFKDDASEVKSGYECGIGIANFNDLKVGDVIEAFKIEKIAAKSL